MHGVQIQFADIKFMKEHEDSGRTRKQRPGVCHRCGWTQPVSKIGRMDSKRLGTGRTFRRLCDECFDDLLRQQSTAEGKNAPRRAKLKVLRHRDVA